MRNVYLVIFSTLLSVILIYIALIIYTFFNFENEFKHIFKSQENLNFHKKYSKKVHHIRDEAILKLLFKKPKVEDLMFTTITELKDKELIVLFQGDSWMEQITFGSFPKTKDDFLSVKMIQNFKSKKKIGFVNGGTASYSPSLMSIQIDILEKDYEILPNIVIAYIDQTDIGDENCRYKYNKIYKKNILTSIEPETHLMYRDLFNYFQIYGLSNIYLSNNSKVKKTIQVINFKFKYNLKKSTLRFYRKYISNFEIEKNKLTKCYGDEIRKYLIKPKKTDIEYFSESVKEYIQKIKEKEHIEKLILVTFPHKRHFFKNLDEKSPYTFNVSSVVENLTNNEENITHINFSKILLNDKNFNYKNIWLDNLHLNTTNHGNLFMKKILDELLKYLL